MTIDSYKKKIIDQVNSSPKELRSFIHSLDVGIDSSIILHNEQLRQENKEMKFVFNEIVNQTNETHKEILMIGKILRCYRNQTGVSLRDLAKELHISAATLSRVENGCTCDQRTMLILITWLFGN